MRTPANPTLTIEHALLGFIHECPSHGYEIYQQLTAPTGLWQVWRIKQGQLYALLTKLENACYLAATLQAQDTRPPRKVYSLTDSGHVAYRAWLTAPVTHGRHMRLEFLTKLYFAQRQDVVIAHQLVEQQISTCQQWLAEVHEQPQATVDSQFFAYAVQEFRRSQIESFLSWLTVCRDMLLTTANKQG